MNLSDPIGDMFARIRNGQLRSLDSINLPSSNFRLKILEILKTEGYINNFKIENLKNNKKNLKVDLKYFDIPVIKEIKEFPSLVEEFIQKLLVYQNTKWIRLSYQLQEELCQIRTQEKIKLVERLFVGCFNVKNWKKKYNYT